MNKNELTPEEYFEVDSEKCPECGSEMVTRLEEREGQRSEIVSYCLKCGETQS